MDRTSAVTHPIGHANQIPPAPIFCAVKLDTPFARVVREVITRLFSFTEAEYPAITLEPKVLITP